MDVDFRGASLVLFTFHLEPYHAFLCSQSIFMCILWFCCLEISDFHYRMHIFFCKDWLWFVREIVSIIFFVDCFAFARARVQMCLVNTV